MSDFVVVCLHCLHYVDRSSLDFRFSMARQISIIGDANVTRNMTGLNVASREVLKTAQVINFSNPIEQSFQQVRAESSVCIVAFLTDQILAAGFCGTLYASVDPVLDSIKTSVSGFCASHPGLQVDFSTLPIKCQIISEFKQGLTNASTSSQTIDCFRLMLLLSTQRS